MQAKKKRGIKRPEKLNKGAEKSQKKEIKPADHKRAFDQLLDDAIFGVSRKGKG
jgi:hypothetical protein